MKVLEKSLSYTFQDKSLLDLALTHRSASGKLNNERMEFLGDSILGYVIAEKLFFLFPEAREGQLTRLRASLVRGTTLASVARDFDLGEFLNLGSGELKSGGYRRESILADAVEAIIGAILLDGGFDEVKRCILAWYDSRLKKADPDQVDKDPKTKLQEWLQQYKQPLPEYTVEKITGQAHNQYFYIRCDLQGFDEAFYGEGDSRRIAEQEAATKAFKKVVKTKGKKA